MYKHVLTNNVYEVNHLSEFLHVGCQAGNQLLGVNFVVLIPIVGVEEFVNFQLIQLSLVEFLISFIYEQSYFLLIQKAIRVKVKLGEYVSHNF